MTKHDLENYKVLKETRDRITAEINLLEQEKIDMCQISGTVVSDMPKAKGGCSDTTANKVFEIAEVSERLKQLRRELEHTDCKMDDVRTDILLAYTRDEITGDQSNVLIFFYLDCLTIEWIADTMNMSESTVKRIKNKGIENLTLQTC
jgi:DNA-directed RNA polymerase specialized sigma subunit